MSALVELHDVFVVHAAATGGVAALRGLSLAVEEREVCVVLGPSGSGKTTLVRLLAGLERPSAGRVEVAGLDLGRASAARLARHRCETIGYADQHYWRALAPGLTVEELVALPLGLRGLDRSAAAARASELLERVGLAERAGVSAAELSGGEQQRVALCAALASRPQLLVADEPTGELDQDAATGVYQLLAELCRTEATTAVVVSHDPASTSVADRVVHVRDGRVSEEARGDTETVVVGRGGWLRVPEQLLRGAGIGDRATIVTGQGSIELRPAREDLDVSAPASAIAAGSLGRPVRLVGVTHGYGGEPVLRQLDLTFEPGALTLVTGPSGSGKSTLLRLVTGLAVPTAGAVSIGEVEVSALDRVQRAAVRRELVGTAGQSAVLVDALTAFDNVLVALALRGVDGDDADERAAEALVAVGLAEALERRVDRLSAGERERVALARVLAARRPVVVLDEPTARLDTATTASVAALLQALARESGTTVICATHDPLVVALADREVALDDRVAVTLRA